jgi:hypothetical protein
MAASPAALPLLIRVRFGLPERGRAGCARDDGSNLNGATSTPEITLEVTATSDISVAVAFHDTACNATSVATLRH